MDNLLIKINKDPCIINNPDFIGTRKLKFKEK